MKKTTISKIHSSYGIVFTILCTLFSLNMQSQCTANYTYSYGPNGLLTVAATSTNNSNQTHHYWYLNQVYPAAVGSTATLTFSANGYHILCHTMVDSLANPICSTSRCDSIPIYNAPTATNQPCHASFTKLKGPNGLVSFTSTSTGTPPSVSYFWQFGSGYPTTNGQTTSFTYTTNGVKWICLTVYNFTTNCSDTYCDSVYITNASATNPCSPTVMFTMYKDSIVPLTWNAVANYPGNVTGATWNWGDGSSSTGLYPSHTYSAAGSYSICVTASVSCGTITAQYCYVASVFKGSQQNSFIQVNVKQGKPTGITEQQTSDLPFTLFPNPGSGIISFQSHNSDIVIKGIDVINVLGEKMFHKEVLDAETDRMDLSAFPDGHYLVLITTNRGVVHKSLILQK